MKVGGEIKLQMLVAMNQLWIGETNPQFTPIDGSKDIY